MPTLMSPLVIRPKPAYFALLSIFTSLFFLVPGVVFLFGLGAFRPSSEEPTAHIYIALVLCSVGVACLAISPKLYGLTAKTIIYPDGIRSSLYYANQLVPWAAVRAVRVKEFKGRHICLDVERTVKRNRYLQINEAIGLGSLNFTTFGSGVSFDDALKLVEKLIAEARR